MLKLMTTFTLAALTLSIGHATMASLHGLAAKDDPRVVFEPALLGRWNSNFTLLRWDIEITRLGESGYRFVWTKETRIEWTVLLFKVRDVLVADIRLSGGDSQGLPVHFLGKVRIDGDTLWFAELGTDWLEQRIARRRHPRCEVIADEHGRITVLTASPADLWKTLLLPYVNEPRAFDDEIMLQRAAIPESK